MESRETRNVRMRGWAKGCLVAVLVVLVIAIIGGIWAWKGFKTFAVATLKEGATQMVRESGVPSGQQMGVLAVIDRLEADYKAGAITLEQFTAAIGSIIVGPMLEVALLESAEEKHLPGSGLSEGDRVAAARTLDRFARGVVEGKIGEAEMRGALGFVTETDPSGKEMVRAAITDDDIRKWIASMQADADAAGIPDEPYTVDYAAWADREVRKALQTPQ